jgi:penicillin-binding protein 2
MKKNRFIYGDQRKLFFFCTILLFVFILLLARLIDLQLVRGQVLAELASQNRYFSKNYLVERALIFDRYQQSLVKNRPNYYLLADPHQLYSQQELIDHNQALFMIATDSASLNRDYSRVYTYPQALAHALGYVTGITADDLVENKQLNFAEQFGRTGLEKSFDSSLRASLGTEVFEVDALGYKQQLVSRTEAFPGTSLSTSLDPWLSEVAYQALADRKGAVVIMDAQTGQILTLISSPSFNPNLFEEVRLARLAKQVNSEAQKKLAVQLDDDRQLFFNRAVSGSYPPGSIFKLVTALAALEEGVLDASTTVLDEGVLEVGEYQYANWYYTQYGRVEGEINLLRAIIRSNDIFFYKAAEWLGPQKLADYSRLLGLGKATGIELSGEALGLVPDPTWKEEYLGEKWFLGNTYHFGIGQGDVLVSPLQLTQVFQTLSNGGVQCRPTLLMSVRECQDLSFREENLDLISRALLGVTQEGGTAFPLFDYNQALVSNLKARLGEQVFENLSAKEKIRAGMIAGKTGTSEFGSADQRGYRATHAWFSSTVGLNKQLVLDHWQELGLENASLEQQAWLEALANNQLPKEIVITVLVESDEDSKYQEGSADAAPIVREILEWMTGF